MSTMVDGDEVIGSSNDNNYREEVYHCVIVIVINIMGESRRENDTDHQADKGKSGRQGMRGWGEKRKSELET